MTEQQALIELIDIIRWVVIASALVFCIPGIIALYIALRLRFYRK